VGTNASSAVEVGPTAEVAVEAADSMVELSRSAGETAGSQLASGPMAAAISDVLHACRCLIALLVPRPGYLGSSSADVQSVMKTKSNDPLFVLGAAINQSPVYLKRVQTYMPYPVCERTMGPELANLVAKVTAGDSSAVDQAQSQMERFNKNLRPGATLDLLNALSTYFQQTAASLIAMHANNEKMPELSAMMNKLLQQFHVFSSTGIDNVAVVAAMDQVKALSSSMQTAFHISALDTLLVGMSEDDECTNDIARDFVELRASANV
jgi:hypothetical protein